MGEGSESDNCSAVDKNVDVCKIVLKRAYKRTDIVIVGEIDPESMNKTTSARFLSDFPERSHPTTDDANSCTFSGKP